MRLIVAEKGDIGVKIGCAIGGVFLSNGEELQYKHLSDSKYSNEIEALKKKLYFESNKGYTITFTNGHMYELKKPKHYEPRLEKDGWRVEYFPVIPDDFVSLTVKRAYSVYERQERRANAVIQLMKQADLIINATDADREGQCIFDIPYIISGSKAKVMRLWVSDQTQEKFKKAINALEDNKAYESLFHAGLCRSFSDWLVGMNLTGIFASHNRRMIHIGRVKTPTLSIIATREKEILNFKPEKHYPVIATFEKNGIDFNTEIDMESLGLTRMTDKILADSIANEVSNELYGKVVEIQEEKENNPPPLLYSNASLLGDAGEYFGYTMPETERVLQDLYEKHDLISYPRTDSNYLPPSMENEIENIYNNLMNISTYNGFGLFYSKPSNRYVRDLNGKSHYAIVPTTKPVDFSKLNEKEQNVYNLVAIRFLCMFARPSVSNKTKAKFLLGRYYFNANGKVVLDKGWTSMYNIQMKDVLLPPLSNNEMVDLVGISLAERETKPPKPYTIKTLGTILENVSRLVDDQTYKDALKRVEGIGTPATRTTIISELENGGYIKQNKQVIRCTPNGLDAIENLEQTSIENLYSPIMTAEWEIKFKDIEEGNLSAIQFMREMSQFVIDSCNKIRNMNKVSSAFMQISSSSNRNTSNTSSTNTSVKSSGNSQGAKGGRSKMGECGFCKAGTIKMFEKMYKCTKCNKIVWKNALANRGLPEIPENMAFKLLAKQRVKTEFISKANKPYKVILSLDDNSKVNVDLDV